MFSAAVLVATLFASTRLGSEFLPKLDEGNLWLTITLPPSTALDRTKEIERTVREILRSYPEVNNVVSQVGRPDDGTDPKGPNNMEIMADLKPHGTWRFPSKEAAWGFWKSAEYTAAKQLRAGKGKFFVTVLDGLPGT